MASRDNQRVLRVLRGVRALLSTPDKFTQRSYARNAVGEPVWWDDSRAVCFCLRGAVGHVVADLVPGVEDDDYDHDSERGRLRNEVQDELFECIPVDLPMKGDCLPYEALVEFNDELGYECVIELVDQTIESVQAQ